MTEPVEVTQADTLVERLRATGQSINLEHIDADMRDIYPQRRADEIDSFIWSIGREHITSPLHYVAQMLSTVSAFSPQFGSHHHATALAAETVLFYADLIEAQQAATAELIEALEEAREWIAHDDSPMGPHEATLHRGLLAQIEATLTKVRSV